MKIITEVRESQTRNRFAEIAGSTDLLKHSDIIAFAYGDPTRIVIERRTPG
jgi:hypothetical protein